MNSEKFLASVELNLTPMAPDFVPGVIKKQLDNLQLSYKAMSPAGAHMFITNVAEALIIFIGPERSRFAKQFMLKKLRECCTDTEKNELYK